MFTVTKFILVATRQISAPPALTGIDLSITTETCPPTPPSLRDPPLDIHMDRSIILHGGMKAKALRGIPHMGVPHMGYRKTGPQICMPLVHAEILQGL